MHKVQTLLILAGSLTLQACVAPPHNLGSPADQRVHQQTANLEKTRASAIMVATGHLLNRLPLNDRGPILLTTLEDIDDVGLTGPDRSSSYARMLSEEVGTALSEQGATVVDARAMTGFSVSPDGVFVLSTSNRRIAHLRKASTILVGLYETVGDKMYLALRLMRADGSGDVIDAEQLWLPRPGLQNTGGTIAVSRIAPAPKEVAPVVAQQRPIQVNRQKMVVIDRYGERTVTVSSEMPE